jgi:asparagine synthase (glutamine-hydrolysing)
MSGIVGIWNLDGKPVEREVLARMSATMAHRGLDGEEMWIKGPVGFACQLSRITPESEKETQPLVGSSGVGLVFDGRLDNREELLADLKQSHHVSSSSPDPDLVLAAYEAFGDRLPERLAGDFALGLFDPSRQRLLLARDAIGIRPLYYCRTRDTFLFASEIKALLAHPQVSSRPNDDLLAKFLLHEPGHPQEMTFFEGVSSLIPAHLAILTPRGFVIRRYWDFDVSYRTRLGSFQEYAEAFRDHFEQAVRRRLRSAYPVAVSVSGGLDSSSIFCLAETLRRQSLDHDPPVLGISYISPDGSPSDEKAFLVEIERDYEVAIERVSMGPAGLLNRSREAVWHVEAPFLDELWNTTYRFLSTVHRRGARVMLTGHWGDQMLFEQSYLIDLFHKLAWGEVRAHLKEFGRWFTDADSSYFKQRFFVDLVKYHVPKALIPSLRRLRARERRPWFTQAFQKRARRGTSNHSAFSRASFPTVHARAIYEQARSSHHVMCMEWNNKVAAMHGLDTAFPFLDRDLLAFLMAIPGEMQTWKGVPRTLLRAAMQGNLPDAIARRTWKADFSHLVNEGAEQDLPRVVRGLESDGMALKLGYVKGNVIRSELERLKDRMQGPTCEAAWSFSDLLGLELWLQVFFGENNNSHEGPGSPEGTPMASMQGGIG